MKTVVVNADGHLSVEEIGKPHIEPNQALTKTIANGICGSDIHIIKKEFKGITPDQYPLMLGHENVGEVVEIGSEVKSLKVGDIVMIPYLDADRENLGPYESGWGACAEYCVVTDPTTYPEGEAPPLAQGQRILPSDIDPVDAVMIVTLREVLCAVRNFGIEAGDAVVVVGSGPVGMTFIKICKLIGAAPVIAAVRNEKKAEIAQSFGADIVVNTSETDLTKEVRAAYPDGVPFVIDAVGSEAVINEAMGLICDRGVICAYGVPKSEQMHIDFSRADYNWNLSFQQMPRKDEEGAVQDEIIAWIRAGELDLKQFISDYYPFDQVLEAYEDAMNKKIERKGIVVYR